MFNPHGLYGVGLTCVTEVAYKGCLYVYNSIVLKSNNGSDRCLQFGNVKKEWPVIVDQPVTVKFSLLPWVLTARHTP